jgi:hypothetical protein
VWRDDLALKDSHIPRLRVAEYETARGLAALIGWVTCNGHVTRIKSKILRMKEFVAQKWETTRKKGLWNVLNTLTLEI